MTKRKAATTKRASTKSTVEQVEPAVVALAARIGSLLGRGAGRLSKLMPGKKRSAKPAAPKRKREGEKAKTAGAPRHRKTQSTAEMFDPRLGEPAGNAVRQKAKRRRRAGA
jgi:hypothetical protein